jgi:hypothetical protein
MIYHNTTYEALGISQEEILALHLENQSNITPERGLS